MHRVMDPARDCQKLTVRRCEHSAKNLESLLPCDTYRSNEGREEILKGIETSFNNKTDSRATKRHSEELRSRIHECASHDSSSRRLKSRNWEMKSRNRKMEEKREESVIRAH